MKPESPEQFGAGPRDGAGAENHAAAEGMEPPAEGPDVMDLLLETEPDDRPEAISDNPVVGHAVVGAKKSLNALLGDSRHLGSGTPAVMNYFLAGLAYMGFTGAQAGGDGGGNGGGESPAPPRPSPSRPTHGDESGEGDVPDDLPEPEREGEGEII